MWAAFWTRDASDGPCAETEIKNYGCNCLMALTRVVERRLSGVPTSLCLTGTRIYVSVKRKHVVETGYNGLRLRRIPVQEGVRTMVGRGDDVFLFSERGGCSTLAPGNGEAKRGAIAGRAVVNAGEYDTCSGCVVVGTSKGKVLVLGEGLEVRKALYESPSGVVCVSVSSVGKVACAYEVDCVVRIFDLKSSEARAVEVPGGFPQALVFVSATHLVVGCSSGELCVVDTSSMSIVFSTAIASAVTALCSWDGALVVGGEGVVQLWRVTEGGIEMVDSHECGGVVNAVSATEGHVVACVGREPRLGRWVVRKDWGDKLVVFRIEWGARAQKGF